tara:strand:+ start:6221 stop:7282 length:1062 start_codon:yes stop_codon:yes gene_type:complete
MKKIINYLCEPRLRIEALKRNINNKNILDNINLSLYPGEILCLLGNSGCGKTSLLRVIAGLDKQSSGEIFVNEEKIASEDIHCPPNKRSISMLFQDYALFPHMTVEENVKYGLKGLDKNIKSLKVDTIIKDLGLSDYKFKYPHLLSGGEQQRVALARAIAPEPIILLMDEPFTGLDRFLRERVREETLSFLRNKEASIILVTHDPEEAMLMGDRIALMNNGRLIQIGTSEELIFNPANRYTVETFSNVNCYSSVVISNSVNTPFGKFETEQITDGQDVDVLIREQAFNLTSATDSNQYIVDQVSFTGDRSKLQLISGDPNAVIKISIPGKVNVKEKDSIGLSIDDRYVHIFTK